MTSKKKICWITPDYFMCVDSFIVPFLKDEYDIEWILINTLNTKRKTEGLVGQDFKPKHFNLKYRQRDFRIVFQYISFLRKVRRMNADLIYISFHGFPFFFPLFLNMVNRKKVLWGVHNVSTPKGASNDKWMPIYQNYVFKRLFNFHVFSKYQLDVIRKILPNRNHFYAPLTLEDYGSSNISPSQNVIRFLFFGYIRGYKRLDLLIEAFQDLYNQGVKHIELYIAGSCENWDVYERLITNREIVKTKIDVIPNEEIPDLVSSCHYMVMPYKDGAQSAVLTLAYQYRKPVIVSDIESFKQYVADGTTGYVFQNESKASLTEVLSTAVDRHRDYYEILQDNIDELVEREFSSSEILNRYRFLLNKCIDEG